MGLTRMTIRRWMITVALVAVIITAGQLFWRSRRFRILAELHQAQASTFAATAARFQPPIVEEAIAAEVYEVVRQFEEGVPLWRLLDMDMSMRPIPVTAQQARREEKQRLKARALFSGMNRAKYVHSQHLAEYHVEMSRKYRRAATQPWLPVPLDPPVPIR
jgi:hypothetical protein